MSAFKKGDKVKYMTGRATKFTKATFERKLKAGAGVPNDKKLKSVLHAGESVARESALVTLKDGTRRLVRTSFLKKA
jgi:hypothetical protein